MDYTQRLHHELDRCYAVASEARKQGYDPQDVVEVKVAPDVAARVESIVGPVGIADRIREMERTGMAREDIAFELAKRIADGQIVPGSPEQRVEQAIRTAVGLLTEGVLVAPTEGISRTSVKSNPDGSRYLAIYYSGPIRSAGGTAMALSVMIGDLARKQAHIGDYRPTDTHVERFVEEVNIYEARVSHLQYKPNDDDLRYIVRHCPVAVDGTPSEDIEVSAYRNVPDVETNRIRGGVPLVLCEGIAQKAGKLLKYSKKYNMGWEWLEKIVKISKGKGPVQIGADSAYLEGLVAGRPVFAYPSRPGGFRLRYGRCRTNGLMAKAIHPAAMALVDDFLAVGTHMKIERPGKGCIVTPHEDLDPPVVKLRDGSVRVVRSATELLSYRDDIAEVLFLGDILITYGDFLKSNQPLMPGGFCTEWWQREAEAVGVGPVPPESAADAFAFARARNLPLPPRYTFPWHDLKEEQLPLLVEGLKQARVRRDGKRIREFDLPNGPWKAALETLLIAHRVIENRLVLEGDLGQALWESLGFSSDGSPPSSVPAGDPLATVNRLSGVRIFAYAPTYIGARMGRPEKAKERKMEGTPHVLFPTGSQQHRNLTRLYRQVKTHSHARTLQVELARFRCTGCGIVTGYRRCLSCGSRAEPERVCSVCQRVANVPTHCDKPTVAFEPRTIDLNVLFQSLREKLGFNGEDIKGVRGLSNASRIPERLEKGYLRAKYNVYVFRDGTSRFDATNAPCTHFLPRELGVSVERLRTLGYVRDALGQPLERDDQLVPLESQDVILSETGATYLLRVTQFIDELLMNVYGLPPFYNAKTPADLIGHMVLSLSPHTSAAVPGRLIGFVPAYVSYCHPYTIAARRRNCFKGSERLLVYDGVEFKLLSLQELVEKNLIGETQTDDFGTRYKRIHGLKTFALNKKTNRFELADITHISKHRSPKTLLELRTKSGRKIIVTPDHSFPDRHGKKIAARDAAELLIPWNISRPTLHSTDAFVISSIVDVTNAMNRIGNKRDKVSIKPSIESDEDFWELLGFYLAEGYTKKKQLRSNQVAITATKRWAKRLIQQKIQRVFGVRPSVSKNQLTICSRYVCELFRRLKIGRTAKTKNIPPLVYSLPPARMGAFLRGYFSGDGSCSLQNSLEVNVTSVNKRLIDGVSFLLSFLGIRHSIYEEKRWVKSDLILKFYGKPKRIHSYKIRIYAREAQKFIEQVGFLGSKQKKARVLLDRWVVKSSGRTFAHVQGDVVVDPIVKKRKIKTSESHVYNLTVDTHHSLICSGITAFQCDGDEDSFMLLLDALLNFSRGYLDEKRGGTMDAPLVLTPRLDPREVDDEVHGIELIESYPLEFYRAAQAYKMPSEIKLRTVKDTLGSPAEFDPFPLTHPGGSLADANLRTAYVRLQSVPEKLEVQFALQDRLRAVDTRDAAQRLMESHFIPDLYGNLRSYSRQTFRCVGCNASYRRPPLLGKCLRCGGNLILTIHKAGIEKYLEISKQIIQRYRLSEYTKQLIDLVEREIRSIFEDDEEKQSHLADFV